MEQYSLLMFILVFLSAYLVIALSHVYIRGMLRHRDKFHGIKVQYWLDLMNECRKRNDYTVKKENIRKLKNTEYLAAFEDALSLLPDKDAGRFFAANEKEFVECAGKMRSEMLQAYIAYIISILHLEEGTEYLLIEELLMKYLLNHSIYLRENVLCAFYNLGKVERVCEALRTLSERDIYHNEKLTGDGLLKFRGDHARLADALVEEFDELMECYKVAILNYLRMSNISSYDDKFRAYLGKENTTVNVKCTIIRLLAKTKNEDNRSAVLGALKGQKNDGQWEVAAVAAASLYNYKDEEVMESLTDSLSSPSWHVRVNAARMLADMQAKEEYIRKILSGGDRYAIEALKYELARKGRKIE